MVDEFSAEGTDADLRSVIDSAKTSMHGTLADLKDDPFPAVMDAIWTTLRSLHKAARKH